MKLKGAIFDLDGTLLDSMFVWNTVGADYLLERGITPRENLRETFRTMSPMQVAEYYRAHYGVTDSVGDIMRGVNRIIEHYYYDTVLPKEGVVPFLEWLRSREVRMCVATATDFRLTEAALKRNGLLEYFQEIFTCAGVGSGKDEPAIYNAALSSLGTPKTETCVFEDALHAVMTAKAAGFPVVGVYDRSEAEHEDQIRCSADLYIRSFTEMRRYMDEKSAYDRRF